MGSIANTKSYTIRNPETGDHASVIAALPKGTDVDAYLCRVLADLPVADRMKIHSEMMKRADEMWDGYSLWLGDAEGAVPGAASVVRPVWQRPTAVPARHQ